MNSKSITAVIILFFSLTVHAQKLSQEFGVIARDEYELSSYEKDLEAEALILFDIGDTYFFDSPNGYDIRFTRTKRIKIFNKAGIEYSEISIPYYVDGYGKTERVVSIEAYTYNLENGMPVKKALDQKTIYEEVINERWRAKKFAFPDVKEGSVIEYKYVLETPFHFNLPDWSFQAEIPTVYSEYTARMIPFYEYVFLAQGISKFDIYNSAAGKVDRSWGSVSEVYGQNVGSGVKFQDMIYTYAMKDVPAFRDESYITSPDDYMMKLDFQLSKFHSPTGSTQEIITTWPDLINELTDHENFGKYIKKGSKVAKKLLETDLNLSGKTETEKSKLIIEYVRSAYSWNRYYGKYASKSVKEFINEKSGNSADINLFLISLLEAAGINVKPVIISTRDHGKISSDYPFDHSFNYVIALVKTDDRLYLADGTDNMLSYDRIPPRCINDDGLVIDEEAVNWLSLNGTGASLDNKTIMLTIDPENLIANTTVTMQFTEYEAYAKKRSFENDTSLIREELLEKGFSGIDKIITSNYDKPDRFYLIAFEGEAPVEAIDNKIIVSPFLSFPMKENDLKQKKRTYPVDFIYPRSEMLKAHIKVPEGYRQVSLPETYDLDNELAKIHVEYKETAQGIEGEAAYTFKKAIYNPGEYARIKHYLDNIVKKFNEQVVLEKM